MTARKFVDYDNIAYFWEKIKNAFVAKEVGKGLSEANYTQAEKTKLDGIASGANNYVHPTYTSKESGLYKVTVDGTGHVSGATSVVKNDITALGIPAQDTTYSNATTEAAGLMSTDDKTKLNGIASGAEVNVQSDWNQTTTTADDYIKNKPTIPTVDTTVSGSSNNAISNSAIKSYVDSAVGAITGISFSIVTELPSTGSAGTIYLLSNGGSSGNSYDEYIWITVSGTGRFEKIGTTEVDLSNYMQFTDMVALTTSEIDTICV